MCGIFGWIKVGPQKDILERDEELDRITRTGMIATMIRGTDATGYFTPKSGVVKDAVEATHFPVPNLSDQPFFIGHCRMASVGSATDPKNAHPFKHGNLVLVHNGSNSRLTRIPNYKTYQGDTDSEIVLSYLRKHGIKAGFEQCDARGSYVVYDTVRKMLFFWKNSFPMEFFYDGKIVYFGSTREIIRRSIGDTKKVIGLFENGVWQSAVDGQLLAYNFKMQRFLDCGMTKVPTPVSSYTYGGRVDDELYGGGYSDRFPLRNLGLESDAGRITRARNSSHGSENTFSSRKRRSLQSELDLESESPLCDLLAAERELSELGDGVESGI